MKVAIVHDYIKEYGGAERVLEALHEVFPDAPVYTTVYLPKFLGPHRERFKGWKIRTSILQYLPLKAKLISPFRLIAPFVFKQFDFSKFDVVIVSATGAYIPNMISNVKYQMSNKPIFITYCHTPPRYLYGYATARDWKKNIFFKILGEVTNHFLRQVDYKSAQNVDYFIANSEEVAGRIRKFYRKDSIVIYPPVDLATSNWQLATRKKRPNPLVANSLMTSGYFLAGGRLARAKHVDLIVETFKKLKLPLIVFGKSFGEKNPHFAKASRGEQKSNIEFVGEVSDQEKMELMKNAKAYVFASEDEDFGITPVEAMAVGTPVIAYNSGGVKETVIDGQTGILYDKNDLNHLIKAIQQFNRITIDSRACIKQAQKFSKERFKRRIREFIKK